MERHRAFNYTVSRNSVAINNTVRLLFVTVLSDGVD
jgi:hypothetical protein